MTMQTISPCLPDYLRTGLRVVFCGTAAGDQSATRRHYYSQAGNVFWQVLHEAGFTPERLNPNEDERVLDYGIGLTDRAKDVHQSHDRGLGRYYDLDALVAKMERHRPRWLAFNGVTAARAARLETGFEPPEGVEPEAPRACGAADGLPRPMIDERTEGRLRPGSLEIDREMTTQPVGHGWVAGVGAAALPAALFADNRRVAGSNPAPATNEYAGQGRCASTGSLLVGVSF